MECFGGYELMSKLLSSVVRSARALTLAGVCAVPLLPGCYTVDSSEPECERDDDCDRGEFCNDDDECENACKSYCSTSYRCFTDALEESACRSSCETVSEDRGCGDAFVGLGKCWSDYSDCTELTFQCAAEVNAVGAICFGICTWTKDGVCDEGTVCPVGSDELDCQSDNSCTSHYDNTCDEGILCAEGTDSYDCDLVGG